MDMGALSPLQERTRALTYHHQVEFVGRHTHTATMATWRLMLSGSIGSLVGVLGLFAVFWLTSRHERRLEADRRAHEQAQADERARTAVIDRVVHVVAAQSLDTRWAPFGQAQAVELFSAVLGAASTINAAHPAVADWVLAQHGRVQAARRRYWRVVWIPFLRSRRAQVWGDELGRLGGQLVAWRGGALPDGWFEEQRHNAP